MNKNERLGIIMRRPLPSVAIRRALRGRPLDTRDLLATWATCEGCGLDFPPHALNADTGLCAVCGGFDEDEDSEDPTVGMSDECADIYRAYMQEKRIWSRRGR